MFGIPYVYTQSRILKVGFELILQQISYGSVLEFLKSPSTIRDSIAYVNSSPNLLKSFFLRRFYI